MAGSLLRAVKDAGAFIAAQVNPQRARAMANAAIPAIITTGGREAHAALVDEMREAHAARVMNDAIKTADGGTYLRQAVAEHAPLVLEHVDALRAKLGELKAQRAIKAAQRETALEQRDYDAVKIFDTELATIAREAEAIESEAADTASAIDAAQLRDLRRQLAEATKLHERAQRQHERAQRAAATAQQTARAKARAATETERLLDAACDSMSDAKKIFDELRHSHPIAEELLGREGAKR